MTIVYRDEKGSPLTADELDGNFHDLDDRVVVLETEGPLGIELIEHSDDGASVTYHLTDGSTQGPFPLPLLKLRPQGEWANSTSYAYGDLVTVRGQGTFLVLLPHDTPAAPAEFDPEAGDSDGDYYFQMSTSFEFDNDVAFSFNGTLPEAEVNTDQSSTDSDNVLLGQYICIRDLIMLEGLSLARAWLEVPPSVSDVDIDITKNGTTIGSINFDVDAQSGSFSFAADVEFTIGDRLGLVLTGSDASAAHLSVTLPLRRTDI